MLALFKMIDISGGNITIDGIDIGVVPPNKVRAALNAIPQEPFFLNGSIRLNLDPYGSCGDDEIEKVISKVRLAHVVEDKGGLDAEIDKETLSQGERQLFCLARAILKKSKVVVLDEATSKYVLSLPRAVSSHLNSSMLTYNRSASTWKPTGSFRVRLEKNSKIPPLSPLPIVWNQSSVAIVSPSSTLENSSSSMPLRLC
jgi:ABC-type transport system involved in Fe-S cluster assembly fused permease/ATPase subunit